MNDAARRAFGAALVAVTLAACGGGGDAAGEDDGEVGGATVTVSDEDLEVDRLDDAVAVATRLADDLAAALPAERSADDADDDGRPAPCDPTDPDGPVTATATRTLVYDPSDADGVLAAARAHLEASGADDVRALREDGDAPQLIAVLGGQRWQVSVLLGRDAGRVGVRVNTPCVATDTAR